MYLDIAHSLVVVPAMESDVRNSPEFSEQVVDVMPFVDYWLGLARARS